MSDLALYEALAASVLSRHGKSSDRLRKVIAGFVRELDQASTDECRQGFELVLRKLRERVAELELPLESERP